MSRVPFPNRHHTNNSVTQTTLLEGLFCIIPSHLHMEHIAWQVTCLTPHKTWWCFVVESSLLIIGSWNCEGWFHVTSFPSLFQTLFSLFEKLLEYCWSLTQWTVDVCEVEACFTATPTSPGFLALFSRCTTHCKSTGMLPNNSQSVDGCAEIIYVQIVQRLYQYIIFMWSS